MVKQDDDGNVVITQKQYDYLVDAANRFYALLDTINVDFQDVYPNWPDDYEEYGPVLEGES